MGRGEGGGADILLSRGKTWMAEASNIKARRAGMNESAIRTEEG